MPVMLSSWNDGTSKQAILDFIARVTQKNSPDYVPPEARVAVFDNDGTLWCEKPLPIQADFLFRRLEQMVHEDASLKSRQPWKAVHEKNYEWLGNVITKHYQGDDSDLKMMIGGLLQCYQGSTIEEFEAAASDFLHNQRHPSLHLAYSDCAYQPMIELLHALTENGFTNYIASGGSRDFMRPVTQDLYGIPPERVIGSTVALEYRESDAGPGIFHTAKLDLFDDGPTKPVRIWSRIGRHPIFAAGNSNGDISMLHYCSAHVGPSFSLLINHDDERREYAYQSGAEEALKRAEKNGWIVASIKDDWSTVFRNRP